MKVVIEICIFCIIILLQNKQNIMKASQQGAITPKFARKASTKRARNNQSTLSYKSPSLAFLKQNMTTTTVQDLENSMSPRRQNQNEMSSKYTQSNFMQRHTSRPIAKSIVNSPLGSHSKHSQIVHNFKSKNFSQGGFFDSTFYRTSNAFQQEGSVQKLPQNYHNQHRTAQGDIGQNFRFAVTDSNFFNSQEESTIKVSALNRDSHQNTADINNLAHKNISIMIQENNDMRQNEQQFINQRRTSRQFESILSDTFSSKFPCIISERQVMHSIDPDHLNEVLIQKRMEKKQSARRYMSTISARNAAELQQRSPPRSILLDSSTDLFQTSIVGNSADQSKNSDLLKTKLEPVDIDVTGTAQGLQQLPKINADPLQALELLKKGRERYLSSGNKRQRRQLKSYLKTIEEEKSSYKMPTKETLLKAFKRRSYTKKLNIVNDISQSNDIMQGMLTVRESKIKATFKNQDERKVVNDYLLHYSPNMLDMRDQGQGGLDLGAALNQKLQMNLVKGSLVSAIRNSMKKAADERQEGEGMQVAKPKTVFDTILTRSLLKTTHSSKIDDPLKKVADKLENRFRYEKRYKHREIDANFKANQSEQVVENHRIQYMKKCNENFDPLLPIFDKVINKTLCLQNYQLSDGHVEGLAKACQFIDTTKLNRMLFNNCGLTADNLATIIQGVDQMKDFKSLIVKQGVFNQNCLDSMFASFKHQIPYHIEEISIIDCKIAPTLIEQLTDYLKTHSCLKKFALVNVQHNEKSFLSVAEFVKESDYLKELDLSMQRVRPSLMYKILKTIKYNFSLSKLSLSYNELLEDQPTALSEADKAKGKTEVKLSRFNQKVVECFKEFIKYNMFLIHLDLTMTGLIAPAMKFLSGLLRKSQALNCLHLDGNPGAEDGMIDWVQTRIHGLKCEPGMQVPPSKTQYKDPQQAQSKPAGGEGGFLMGLLAKNAPKAQLKIQSEYDSMKRAIREGVKNRNILQSANMQGLNDTQSNFGMEKMLVTRQLGFKQVIPGAAQWIVNSDMRQDCWICSQSTMTIFIWTPRVGQMTAVKDAPTIQHYDEMMKNKREELTVKPFFTDGHPQISGQFTDWKPQKMHDMIEFLTEHDQYKPDFIELAISKGKLDAAFSGEEGASRLDADQREMISQIKEEYYMEHWHRCIMPFLRYKQPHVANADDFPFSTLKPTANERIYFYVSHVKPGRNTYVVQHVDLLASQHAKKPKDRKMQRIHNLTFQQIENYDDSKVQEAKTYVHQILVPFRNEPIYHFTNPRHSYAVKTHEVPLKNFSEGWQTDDAETYSQIYQSDWSQTAIDDIIFDRHELKRFNSQYFDYMVIFLDVFHYLRSRSKSYPLIDIKLLESELLVILRSSQLDPIITTVLKLMAVETCVQSDFIKTKENKYEMNRAMLLEYFMRLAFYLFGDLQINKKLRKLCSSSDLNKPINDYSGDNVSPAQSFHMFLKVKLQPYHEKKNINWQQFRDESLWRDECQLVLTINEPGLKAIFDKYRISDQQWLRLTDCEYIVQDLRPKFQFNPSQIQYCFSMSKQTVANELDEKEMKEYFKLYFIEFLEFIARLADMHFEESEMADLPLEDKLAFLLQDLLPLVQHSYKKNQILIEEFSDSDDDY